MRTIITFLFAVFLLKVNAQENIKYIELNGEFKPNETVCVFGDNVKLCSKPNTQSETLKMLRILDKVTILEKTDKTLLFNGINWKWYKVKKGNSVGYVIGGLLSQDTKSIKNSTYLVSFKKKKKNTYILIRLVHNGNNYLEHENIFGTESTFTIRVFNDRGVANIKDMVYIDYIAESCGVNGGGYFLFNEGEKLTKAIDLSSVGDGGIYWNIEEVVFPNDEKGKEGKILYKSETGEVLDDTTNRTKITIETCEFTWQGKELKLSEIKE